MKPLDLLGDGCAVVAVTAAIYEVAALLTGRPPITDLVWGWRQRGGRLVLLVLLVWAALGWHLFVEMRGVRR